MLFCHVRDFSRNRLSGTLEAFGTHVSTLILSNNEQLSGTVPHVMQTHSMKALLLNGMRLSGTVMINSSSIQTLSLARNSLEGPTDSMSMAHGLRTLIISGNYFSVSCPYLSSCQ